MDKYAGFIYEWTNKVNKKKYLGAHTGTIDDGYTGGGSEFRCDLKKYGLINFERKILEYVSDEQKIKDRENYYLNLVDAADNTDYYNKTNKSSGLRKRKLLIQSDRKICSACNQRPAAINYTRDTITHYRSRCSICISKHRKIKAPVPRWEAAGYKKKTTCDRCGFRSKYSAQLLVYHIDGNLANSNLRNLKTICRNCVEEVKRADLPWRPGDLQPDF
jgi:hypothetical protein